MRALEDIEHTSVPESTSILGIFAFGAVSVGLRSKRKYAVFNVKLSPVNIDE